MIFAVIAVIAGAAPAARSAELMTLEAARVELQRVAFDSPLYCRQRLYEYKTDKGRLILQYRDKQTEAASARWTMEHGYFQWIIDRAKARLEKILAEIDQIKKEAAARGVDLERDRLQGGVDYETICIRDPKL